MKLYAGARLRRVRDEHGLTQSALARRLGVSPSYLNQIEHDQRPLTVTVLLRMQDEFGVDAQFFAVDSDARLAADLRDLIAGAPGGRTPGAGEIDELIRRMPDVAHLLVDLERQLVATRTRLEELTAAHVGPGGRDLPDAASTPGGERVLTVQPYERVRDYFYDRHNHIDTLDAAAEDLAERLLGAPSRSRALRPTVPAATRRPGTDGAHARRLDAALVRHLDEHHGIAVLPEPAEQAPPRRYDPATATLYLADHLTPGRRAFQLATQIALVEHAAALDALVAADGTPDPQARGLLRIGLAHYFAGATVLPYGRFLAAADELRYDIDLLGMRFGVGFETVCHRLSTLQRTGRRGVPFFFVRTDKAGNISKRQSASSFHFSRVGGGCPLWVVHDAFARPGRILRQVARMPDGRTYLWIARTTDPEPHAYGTADRVFAIGLGCDIGAAEKLVYSQGLDLTGLAGGAGMEDGEESGGVTPIGAGCKVCPRTNCVHRAFPPLGALLDMDENRSAALPYPTVSAEIRATRRPGEPR